MTRNESIEAAARAYADSMGHGDACDLTLYGEEYRCDCGYAALRAERDEAVVLLGEARGWIQSGHTFTTTEMRADVLRRIAALIERSAAK